MPFRFCSQQLHFIDVPLCRVLVCRITHYEERLKALYFKKKFQERRLDCKQKIEGEQQK